MEINNKISSHEKYVETLKEKLNTYKEDIEESRKRTVSRQELFSPLIRQRKRKTTKAESSKAARFLIKTLSADTFMERVIETQDNSFSAENFFKHRISEKEYLIIRDFDQIKIQVSNFREQLTVKQYFKSMIYLFFVKIELFVIFFLITIFCFKEGLMGSVYIVILLFMIIIENRIKSISYWQVLYLLFILNFIVQLVISHSYAFVGYDEDFREGQSENLPYNGLVKVVIFLYGKVHYGFSMFVFVIMELMMIHLCDNFDFDRTFAEIENPSQAIFRITFNNHWEQIFNRENNIILGDINLIEQAVKKKKKQKLKEKEFMVFLVSLLKRKSALHKSYKEKFEQFLKYLLALIPVYNKDRLIFLNLKRNRGDQPANYENERLSRRIWSRVTTFRNKFKSYFWRNFAFQLRKPGTDLSDYILLSLIAILIYFFVFYFQLQGSDISIMEILNNNEIQGTLGINFSIIFLSICIERLLYSRISLYWIESTQTDIDKVITRLRYLNIDEDSFKSRAVTSREKFQRAVKKVCNVNRLSRPLLNDTKSDYKHNPLILKFYFIIVFYTYMIFLIFVQFPSLGHQHLKEDVIVFKKLCNDRYRTVLNEREGVFRCNNYYDNHWLQVLFFLTNLYMLLSILQIKKGFSSVFYFQSKAYQKFGDVARFYFYKFTPYIREIRTIIDYSASSTALNLFQWFKLEDIETTIISAKVNEIYNRYRGTRLDMFTKRLTGLSFLVLFFFLLIAPLYLFSDILPNNIVDEVSSAQISVKTEINDYSFNIYRNLRY